MQSIGSKSANGIFAKESTSVIESEARTHRNEQIINKEKKDKLILSSMVNLQSSVSFTARFMGRRKNDHQWH
jgi:hypothetical protein